MRIAVLPMNMKLAGAQSPGLTSTAGKLQVGDRCLDNKVQEEDACFYRVGVHRRLKRTDTGEIGSSMNNME